MPTSTIPYLRQLLIKNFRCCKLLQKNSSFKFIATSIIVKICQLRHDMTDFLEKFLIPSNGPKIEHCHKRNKPEPKGSFPSFGLFLLLLFASYSFVLSAHITSVNTVNIRIRLLGPLQYDVSHRYFQLWGLRSTPLSMKSLPVYTNLWLYIRYVPLFLSIHRSECHSRLPFSHGLQPCTYKSNTLYVLF